MFGVQGLGGLGGEGLGVRGFGCWVQGSGLEFAVGALGWRV